MLQEQFAEKKNDERISDEEFKLYFNGEKFKQDNLGNCYFVAVLDGLVSFGGYKKLIVDSVKRKDNSFEIVMPLGDPHGKKYEILDSDLHEEQVKLNGLSTALVNTSMLGIKAIALAYGRHVTGKKIFDWNKLSGGQEGQTLNTLIYNFNTYQSKRSRNKKSRKFDMNDMKFESQLLSGLQSFDASLDIMTVAVQQGEAYDLLLPLNTLDKKGTVINNQHALSVEKVIKQNGVVDLIVLSNPYDVQREYAISYEKFKKLCLGYSLGSMKMKQGLDVYTDKHIENQESSNVILGDIEKRLAQLKGEIGSSSVKSSTLNELVQLTGKIDKNQRIQRGDLIVSRNKNINYIKSRNKTDTYIKDFKIFSGGHSLVLNYKDILDNITDQYKYNALDSKYLPRLGSFVNKMRHDYIDKQSGGSENPFYLDKYGTIRFDDGVFSGGFRRFGANLLGDKGVNVLQNRSVFGISDDENKHKIINFLNVLYKSKKKS